MLAWHFLYENNKMRDGRTAPDDGVVLKFDAEPILCEQGLHASLQPFDALQYAPGPILCLVECSGKIVQGEDKIVCTERKIIARMDDTELLRYFARMQALSVADKWDAPDVVLDYLRTGDKSIMVAAESAAWGAALGAALGAARYAALSAAESASGYAARYAARYAVRYAAESAAWDAALGAALDASADAAWDAARVNFNSLVEEAFVDYL
jgi:hypothetical protein